MSGNRIADRITKVSQNLQQNRNDKEIAKERYISPEKRQETIDGLRLK